MKFVPIRRLTVDLDLQGERRAVGVLAWSQEERRAYFEYAPDFLARPLPVSPFNLKVRSGLIGAGREPFDGLHGLFNDSLPDGWGRLLLDRRLQKAGVDFRSLTPLDRLSAVGTKGMGALRYIPELEHGAQPKGDLDWFVEQTNLVQSEMDTADIEALQGAQGGSAGARPKIMIGLNGERNAFVLDYGDPLDPGFEHWLVKARGADDDREIGIEEAAYALMARAAGIEMAETRVIGTKNGSFLFATRRFDRVEHGRIHMHTASGLLNASHREASLDYIGLHKLTRLLTRDAEQVLQMFTRMAFNVFARNRDDHAKNHAFLLSADGVWRLSPAYDLTFSSGPGGQHSAAIAGEGARPNRHQLLKVAAAASISKAQADEMIDRVRSAIARWPQFAEEAGLSVKRTRDLHQMLNQGMVWDN